MRKRFKDSNSSVISIRFPKDKRMNPARINFQPGFLEISGRFPAEIQIKTVREKTTIKRRVCKRTSIINGQPWGNVTGQGVESFGPEKRTPCLRMVKIHISKITIRNGWKGKLARRTGIEPATYGPAEEKNPEKTGEIKQRKSK